MTSPFLYPLNVFPQRVPPRIVNYSALWLFLPPANCRFLAFVELPFGCLKINTCPIRVSTFVATNFVSSLEQRNRYIINSLKRKNVESREKSRLELDTIYFTTNWSSIRFSKEGRRAISIGSWLRGWLFPPIPAHSAYHQPLLASIATPRPFPWGGTLELLPLAS